MKLLSGILAGLLFTTVSFAQNIDEARMARDIKIAQDIIAGLMNQSEGMSQWYASRISGNYIPEYGMIFSIPSDHKKWPLGIKLWNGEDGHIVIGDRIRITDDDGTIISGLVNNYQEYQEATQDYLENMMITFLTDYADLIGQLKPEDKIMIKSEQNLHNVYVLGSARRYHKYHGENKEEDGEEYEDDECCEGIDGYTLSAEVKKSDLTAYRSSKIDYDELVDRISVEKSENERTKEPELELLSSIFGRLYKADLSDTYFATRPPKYNRISNLGVIYEWQVYSSNIDDEKHNMPTINSFGLSVEERNAKVEQLYPLFLEQFKQQLVEYGRTLKGLDSDEMLMFKIKLTQCKGCSIPKAIDVSVKKSVLEDFERQKIDLPEASSKVKVQEHMTD